MTFKCRNEIQNTFLKFVRRTERNKVKIKVTDTKTYFKQVLENITSCLIMCLFVRMNMIQNLLESAFWEIYGN